MPAHHACYNTPTCGVDIIDKILATSDACNASSSQSLWDEQNVTEMIECFNNQARLLGNINIFEWRGKQAHYDLKRVANVALTLLASSTSVERTFSDLRCILNELRFGLKEDIIEAIMFHRCNT